MGQNEPGVLLRFVEVTHKVKIIPYAAAKYAAAPVADVIFTLDH